MRRNNRLIKIKLSLRHFKIKRYIKKCYVRDLISKSIDVLRSHNKLVNINSMEIYIRVTNEKEIHYLNKKFRNIDKSTNVLTFEYGIENKVLKSDIILCLPVLEKESQNQNKNLIDHISHIVIHGFLHSVGYDHINNKEAIEMENLEIEILRHMDISNPYI